MRTRSPLKIPLQRGPGIRYWTSGFCLAICAIMLLATIDGIVEGQMTLKVSRYGNGRIISRADHPGGFWFATIFNVVLVAVLAQAAVREILYTNRHKGSLGRNSGQASPVADMEESPFKELAKPGYYERAQERAQRRKSPWNLLIFA